jgi:hypothetical protein
MSNYFCGMEVTIELSPEVESGLSAQAAVQGISLQQYLRRVLEGQLFSERKLMTPRERAAFWRQSVIGLPRTPPLPDRAMSRETIYDTRG